MDFITHSKHSTWKFEYNQRKNIFRTDVLDIDDNVFVQFKGENKNENKDGILTESDLDDFRKASIIHKVARKQARKYLYPGGKLSELVDNVELTILKLTKQGTSTKYFLEGSPDNNRAGIAFPVGVNINNVVAHDSKTVLIDDDRYFVLGDVVKIDIGVHINGRIIDSAFTHIISSKAGITDDESIYVPLLEASRDSMFSTIKMSGPDQLLVELSENIKEIIESYEIDLKGDMMPIRPVDGIGGHNIKQYEPHGGKYILCVPNEEFQGEKRMEEDEIYAIETYATTGLGQITQNDTLAYCTHFKANNALDALNVTKKEKKIFRNLPLYEWMKTRYGMPFSSSWLQTKQTKLIDKYDKAIKLGLATKQIDAYPPLYDETNSVVAQFEHTIHIGNNYNDENMDTIEIFSLGDDY